MTSYKNKHSKGTDTVSPAAAGLSGNKKVEEAKASLHHADGLLEKGKEAVVHLADRGIELLEKVRGSVEK